MHNIFRCRGKNIVWMPLRTVVVGVGWWWVTNYEIPRFALCMNTYISTSMHMQSILHENNSAPSNYPLYLTQPVGINPHLHSPQDKDFNFPPSNDRDVFFIVFHAVLNIILWSVASHMSFFILIPTLHDLSLYRKFSQLCLYIYIFF